MRIYCGEMVRSPGQLFADWVRGGNAGDLSHWPDNNVILTQSGRAAIALAARLWHLGEGDEVLVPAYNCGSEISPLIATGAKVSMYRVDVGARIDTADLLARLTPRTRLVCVTHYFGRPSETGELSRICRDRNIKLLEDCALSLFSSAIGNCGDAAIYSLRKSLPAFDGGVLLIRGAEGVAHHALPRAALSTSVQGVLRFLAKSCGSVPFYRRIERPSGNSVESGPQCPDIPASYYCAPDMDVRRASRFATGLLRRTVAREVVKRRRENYAHLRQRLSGLPNLRFLWNDDPLEEGICPLGLPMLAESKQYWCDTLNALGVVVSPWWTGHHRGLDWSAFPEALALKSQLILLPVHQGLTKLNMEYIAHVVSSIAAGGRSPRPWRNRRNPREHPISLGMHERSGRTEAELDKTGRSGVPSE